MSSHTTCHSEFGELRSLFLKRPLEAMMDDHHIDISWKELNFLDRPSFAGAKSEYEQFEKLLGTSSIAVNYLPQDPGVTMDSMYCRDASIATDFGMILCNMGKEARKPEPAACRTAFEAAGIPILGAIQG